MTGLHTCRHFRCEIRCLSAARILCYGSSSQDRSHTMATDAGCGALHAGQELVLYSTAPKFDGTTTNQDTYKRWPVEARTPPSEFPAPERIKFEGGRLHAVVLAQWIDASCA